MKPTRQLPLPVVTVCDNGVPVNWLGMDDESLRPMEIVLAELYESNPQTDQNDKNHTLTNEKDHHYFLNRFVCVGGLSDG